MRVPVILDLPHQEALSESAEWARTGRPKGILGSTRLPDAVRIDATYSAVPLGSPNQNFFDALKKPDRWARFAVRGSVDVDKIENMPHRLGDANVLADPRVDSYVGCLADPAVGDHKIVGEELGLKALHDAGLDGDQVAIAILDTGVNLPHLSQQLGRTPSFDRTNSWRPPGISVAPGEYPVGHGTMCAYAAMIAAPKATLIDVPVLLGTPPGGSGMGRRLSTALGGVSHLTAFWAVAFSFGGQNRYKALVVNNSWGMYHSSWDFPPGHPGRYSDNPTHVFNRYISILSDHKADILFAAGNCGGGCPDTRCENEVTSTITGANASRDVLTVAACDVAGLRAGYSSQGPAIAGMFEKKPDITAFTHFMGSEALGPGKPDVGTSAACPVAAGCIAALRTSNALAGKPPTELFDAIRRTARQTTGIGWNGNFGYGVVSPVGAAQELGLIASS